MTDSRFKIVTTSGRYFDFKNINSESIHIKDICHALPKVNRFTGHSTVPWSVGVHSLACYQMAKDLGYSVREQLLVLIHDFTEAYVGDVASPLKYLLPDYIAIEKQVETAIYEHLRIDPPNDEECAKIKKIDLTLLMLEMRYFTNHDYTQFMNEDTFTEFIDNERYDLRLHTGYPHSAVSAVLEMAVKELLVLLGKEKVLKAKLEEAKKKYSKTLESLKERGD